MPGTTPSTFPHSSDHLCLCLAFTPSLKTEWIRIIHRHAFGTIDQDKSLVKLSKCYFMDAWRLLYFASESQTERHIVGCLYFLAVGPRTVHNSRQVEYSSYAAYTEIVQILCITNLATLRLPHFAYHPPERCIVGCSSFLALGPRPVHKSSHGESCRP